ncbi:hypothetical protein T484DRAFT_1936691 [Baffinella frigidus]|nr:hypothetical protein T484DRAFT_1936691 [Cryptophyta sp. CCMP2293]
MPSPRRWHPAACSLHPVSDATPHTPASLAAENDGVDTLQAQGVPSNPPQHCEASPTTVPPHPRTCGAGPSQDLATAKRNSTIRRG